MKRAFPVLVLLSVAACGGSDTADRPQQPPTQRERDSAIANSRLPGAQGVGAAMSAADSAAARRALEDSIAREAR
jgi:hypothetical protein